MAPGPIRVCCTFYESQMADVIDRIDRYGTAMDLFKRLRLNDSGNERVRIGKIIIIIKHDGGTTYTVREK